MRLFDLTGKVAVVTGGTRGIGLMMAAACSSAGASGGGQLAQARGRGRPR